MARDWKLRARPGEVRTHLRQQIAHMREAAQVRPRTAFNAAQGTPNACTHVPDLLVGSCNIVASWFVPGGRRIRKPKIRSAPETKSVAHASRAQRRRKTRRRGTPTRESNRGKCVRPMNHGVPNSATCGPAIVCAPGVELWRLCIVTVTRINL